MNILWTFCELQNIRTIVKVILFRQIAALTTFAKLWISGVGYYHKTSNSQRLCANSIEPCFIFLQYPKIILNILFYKLSSAIFRRFHSDNMKFLITKMNRFICGFFSRSNTNLKNSCPRFVYHVIILYKPVLLLYQSRLTITEDLLYRWWSYRRRLKVSNGYGNGAGNGTRNLRRLTSRFINLIL